MDYCKIGEMIFKAIQVCNNHFEDFEISHRFTEDLSGGDEVYDVYMAKKKKGKMGLPKDDYPSKIYY